MCYSKRANCVSLKHDTSVHHPDSANNLSAKTKKEVSSELSFKMSDPFITEEGKLGKPYSRSEGSVCHSKTGGLVFKMTK